LIDEIDVFGQKLYSFQSDFVAVAASESLESAGAAGVESESDIT